MPQDNWKFGGIVLPPQEMPVALPKKPAVNEPGYDVWMAMARKMAANPPASESELDKFKKGLYGNK